MRNFLLGIAAGFTAGYAAYRTYEAFTTPLPIKKRSADPSQYGATRRALSLAGIARSLAASSSVAYGPLGAAFEGSVRALPGWLQPMLFASQALLVDAFVELPIDFIEGFSLERRYDLSDQPARSWLSDKLKGEVIGGAVAVVLSGLFAAALRRWPTAWPNVASLAVFPLLLLANLVVPIYVMPLFNEYRPIQGDLEARLRALAARFGVGNAEILRVDMSKQTKKANAFVTGIGNTHRIVLGDTLIEQFPQDEIEFVVAHELGHYVCKDGWRMMAIGQVAAMAILYGTFLAVRSRGAINGQKPTALARIQWTSLLLSQFLRPAINAFTRSREWAADRFAVSATQSPQTGAAALRRLREQNLAEDQQPAWYEFFFSTHPSLKARIGALEAAAVHVK